jgi:hypothetical protein
MTHTNARDLGRNSNDPADAQSPLAGTLPLLVLAVVLALIVIVMAYQRPSERAGDTNAGPSVQTVTPAPSPSTSPPVPTPTPTTEPRPTQAPIQ